MARLAEEKLTSPTHGMDPWPPFTCGGSHTGSPKWDKGGNRIPGKVTMASWSFLQEGGLHDSPPWRREISLHYGLSNEIPGKVTMTPWSFPQEGGHHDSPPWEKESITPFMDWVDNLPNLSEGVTPALLSETKEVIKSQGTSWWLPGPFLRKGVNMTHLTGKRETHSILKWVDNSPKLSKWVTTTHLLEERWTSTHRGSQNDSPVREPNTTCIKNSHPTGRADKWNNHSFRYLQDVSRKAGKAGKTLMVPTGRQGMPAKLESEGTAASSNLPPSN